MPDSLFENIELYLKENKEETSEYKLFTEEEYQQIILMAVAGGDQEEGVDEDTILHIVRWAEATRTSQSLLELLLQGLLYPSWDEEEHDVAFKLAEGINGLDIED